MIALKEALPYLVLDLESALVHIGRGDVVDQLREVMIERWTYDELADAAYLHFTAAKRDAAEPSGETVSVYDELGINLAGVQRLLVIGEAMQRVRPLMDERALTTEGGRRRLLAEMRRLSDVVGV